MHYNTTNNLFFCRTSSFICLLVLFLSIGILPQHVLAEFEKPGTLKDLSFLEPELQKGKNFTVDNLVKNDGMFNHYSVTSPVGIFKASSTSSLKMLVREIEAIVAMKKVETDDTVVESLKQSGKNTVTGIKNLFTAPKETLEGAAAGVGSLFNRAKETIGKREVTGAEDSKAEQLIGFSKSKGKIASQYRVNVYSRNKILQEELERLAWADYFGGLGVGAATSFVPGVGGIALTASGTARLLNEAINTTPASELWVQNKTKLTAMGMNADTVELFLNNSVFSPALTTVMTAALESMKNVDNRELFIKVALQASTPDMARVITEIAAMSAGYNKHREQIIKLAPMARIARGEKNDGSAVVFLPVDYLIWSEKVGDTLLSLMEEMKKTGSKKVEIWVLGNVSEVARREMEKMGWSINTDAQQILLPGER